MVTNGGQLGVLGVNDAKKSDWSYSAFIFVRAIDSFDNFLYESASSSGRMSIVDDTSSVYTANAQDNSSSVDLSSLSISDFNPTRNGHIECAASTCPNLCYAEHHRRCGSNFKA